MRHGLVLRGITALLLEMPHVYAADTQAVTAPEPAQYVRICDAMGAGFYQIPRSEVCLKTGGSVGYDITAGSDVSSGERRKTWNQRAKVTVFADAQSDTDWGVLHSYLEFEGNVVDGVGDGDGATFSSGFIELNGLQVGASDSQFGSWLGSAGNVLNDDVVAYAGGMTGQINYTASFGNGSSAMIGVEQGAKGEESSFESADHARAAKGGEHDYRIDSYMPHLVGGLGFERRWGKIATVIGYDSVIEEIATKARLDLQFGDTVSIFIMGSYQSDDEKPNYFGAWKGTYAAWSGISVRLSPKATLNSQAAYEESGTQTVALNLEYEVVPGVLVTPELGYTSFGSDPENPDDALAGIISIQRDF